MIGKAVFELTLKMGKIPVYSAPHISESIIDKVTSCKKFNDYVKKIEQVPQGVIVNKIEILGVEMFGEKVGFVNLRAVTTKDGYSLPSYVFLRGPAVAILMFVNKKLLLVEQFRVPLQQMLLEAPAGMLDESGDFVGTAAAEIQEQTSISITNDKLHSLGSFYPSAGGSDEQILMFYSDISIPEEQMKQIQSKIHGKEGQSERIKVKFVDYDKKTILETRDSKLICLMYAYENKINNEAKL